MPRLLMTPQWLSGLTPVAQGAAEWWDAAERGLILRARGGRFVWSVRYLFQGSYKRYRLGVYPGMTLATARKAAKRTRVLADNGNDPQEQRRAAREDVRKRRLGETIRGALGSWIDDKKQGPHARWKGGVEGSGAAWLETNPGRPLVWSGTARAFLPHVRRLAERHGDKGVGEITPRLVERFVGEPVAAATRNKALTVVRMFLRWACRKELVESSVLDTVAREITKEREIERSRVLTDAEIRAMVRGFDSTRYGRAVRMLFLTGLRRDEVLGMQWDWVDESGTLTIPQAAEKSGRVRGEPRRLALGRQAHHLLAGQRAALFAEGVRSPFVFATSTGERPHPDALKPVLYRLRGRRTNGLPPSTDKRAKPRIAVLPDDVSIHDVRRTVANALLNRVKAQPWIVDHVVLGHVRPKLLRTYMPVLPLDEAREALERWGDEFAAVVDGVQVDTQAAAVPPTP